MADYIKKRTHIINHVRFLRAGVTGRDLYDWGMLWSGQQETDGEIPMEAVLASPWGAGGRRNVVVASKLVEVGLWERTDTGWRILKWIEQGNLSRADLDLSRKRDRDRKRSTRGISIPALVHSDVVSDICPTRTPPGIPPGIPTSTCIDLGSGSGSGSGSRDPEPDKSRSARGLSAASETETAQDAPGPARARRPSREPTRPAERASGPRLAAAIDSVGAPPPAWWSAAIDTAEASGVGVISDPSQRWLEYDAARERKGWARGHRDAVGWLVAVMRSERTRSRRAGVAVQSAEGRAWIMPEEIQ